MIPLLLTAIVFAIIGLWPLAIVLTIAAFLWPLIAVPFRMLFRAVFGRPDSRR